MARAKVESQDLGTTTKGHGKAMTKWPYKLLRRKHELKVGDNLNKQFGSTPSKRIMKSYKELAIIWTSNLDLLHLKGTMR